MWVGLQPILNRHRFDVLDKLPTPLGADVILEKAEVVLSCVFPAALRRVLVHEAVDQRSYGETVKLLLWILRVNLDAKMFDRSLRIYLVSVFLDGSN